MRRLLQATDGKMFTLESIEHLVEGSSLRVAGTTGDSRQASRRIRSAARLASSGSHVAISLCSTHSTQPVGLRGSYELGGLDEQFPGSLRLEMRPISLARQLGDKTPRPGHHRRSLAFAPAFHDVKRLNFAASKADRDGDHIEHHQGHRGSGSLPAVAGSRLGGFRSVRVERDVVP
jgi:hypothetical protein